MKQKNKRAVFVFCLTAFMVTQTMLAPLTGAFAATDNKNSETTGGTNMTELTTYDAYNLNQVDVTDAYLTNAKSKDIEYLLSFILFTLLFYNFICHIRYCVVYF